MIDIICPFHIDYVLYYLSVLSEISPVDLPIPTSQASYKQAIILLEADV